jgi:hypothetical protein
MSKIKLGEQLSAIRKAQSIVSGAEKTPSVTRERDYVCACLGAATVTLEWLRDNEADIRAAVAAKKAGAGE